MKRTALAAMAALMLLSPATTFVSAADLTQLDMNAAPTLSQEQIRQVQQALQKKGFSPGPIDGVLGPVTRGAIRKFQDRFGINANGELNNQTLFALGETDLAA